MLKECFPQNNTIAPITRFLLKWETDRQKRNSQMSINENAFQVPKYITYFKFTWWRQMEMQQRMVHQSI